MRLSDCRKKESQKKNILLSILLFILAVILLPCANSPLSYAATSTTSAPTPTTTTPTTTSPPTVTAVPLAAVAPGAVIVSINGTSYKINGSAKQGAATTTANVPSRIEVLDGTTVKCSAAVSGVNINTRFNCSYTGTYSVGQTISTLKIRFCITKGCAAAVTVPPMTTYALKYADVDCDGKILGEGLNDMVILSEALKNNNNKLTPPVVAANNIDSTKAKICYANSKTNTKLCSGSTDTETIDHQCLGAIAAGWVSSPTPTYPVSTVYTAAQSGCP